MISETHLHALVTKMRPYEKSGTAGFVIKLWADELAALLLTAGPQETKEHHESRSPDGDGPLNAAHQPMNMPRWKCRQCGCLWRDNLDGSVSLFDANQKSCQNCEMLPTAYSCVIEWFKSHAEPQALYNLLGQAKDALAAVIADCDEAGSEPADSHSPQPRAIVHVVCPQCGTPFETEV